MKQVSAIDRESYQKCQPYGTLPIVTEDGVVDVPRRRPGRSILSKTRVVLAICVLVVMVTMGNRISNQPVNGSVSAHQAELLGHSKGNKDLNEYQVPHYYNDQLVDHFAVDTTTWSHRYYVSSEYFNGPGSPLFVIMGGEGPIDEILYPFVYETLAKKFGAYVLQTEHRYYGNSIPTMDGADFLPTSDELKELLSPDQALKDYVRITRHIQANIGCSPDRSSPDYCPVITVGASYPGFLSAMMRVVYPDLVDMSYASSAPLLLYSQELGSEVYFDYVSLVADAASPGCADAYKTTLHSVHKAISSMPIEKAAKKLGICPNVPSYIKTPKMFADELTMLVGFANADFNMDYHPPGDKNTDTIKACKVMQKKHSNAMERLAEFLEVKAASIAMGMGKVKCYDLHWDIPPGKHATITGADWSGMGEGYTANSWEFQCCKDLIIETGFGPNSMFLERPFDLDWLTEHCEARFEVAPEPTRLVDEWHFDDLVGQNVTNILFTNGFQDGWSSLSHTEDLSDTLVALNFPSGAHHSDLNTCCKHGVKENDDIIEGRIQIANILEKWIADVKG
eukprot:Nitzschia sp. Nitz4//scaffold291_size36643//18249//19943//NITZ4_007765-RA/size36643-processed-gene-0.29-mRNA-1//-1//CDS//3329546133//2864//frame0